MYSVSQKHSPNSLSLFFRVNPQSSARECIMVGKGSVFTGVVGG